MSNKIVPSERDIEKLLKTLGAAKQPYPESLLEARRAAYLSQVISAVGSGPHIETGKGAGQGGSSHASAPMTPVAKAILTTLIAANLVLATYLAISVYENWDSVQELLFGATSVSETSPAPFEAPTQPPASVTAPVFTALPEGTASPVSTPEPSGLPENLESSGGDSVNSTQTNPLELEVGTPEPAGNDNPGLHLGQTPHGPGDPPGQDNPQVPDDPPGQDNPRVPDNPPGQNK